MFRSVTFKTIVPFLILSFGVLNCHGQTQEQITKVLLREVANEFLMQINDSTSRILPIKKINQSYQVQFEKKFSFEPDLLFFSCYKILADAETRDSFIVEVKEEKKSEIIHSFIASAIMNTDKTACKLRALPVGKYSILFTPLNPEASSQKKTNSFYYFLSALLIILAFLYIYKKNRHVKLQSNLISIGLYKFDYKGMLLLFDSEKTELSGKESSLLHLLHSNKNTTLKRDDILNQVWGDEGNYIGRTLDVFVSKLRKKLEKDPSIQIINIRGVGYRLVIE